MALMDIDSELGDEGVRESELRQGIHGNGKLANANQADAELRNGDETAGKLTDRNDAPGWHRDTVGPVFEGNVQHREPQECGFGLVFKTPAVPFGFPGEWRPAIGTRHCLFGDLVSAFPARFHILGAAHLSLRSTAFSPSELSKPALCSLRARSNCRAPIFAFFSSFRFSGISSKFAITLSNSGTTALGMRSEERRVGKECRSRSAP